MSDLSISWQLKWWLVRQINNRNFSCKEECQISWQREWTVVRRINNRKFECLELMSPSAKHLSLAISDRGTFEAAEGEEKHQ